MTETGATAPHGIILTIVRGPHDCTLGGISSRYEQVTVVGVIDDLDRPLGEQTLATAATRVENLPAYLREVPATDDAPAVWLRVRTVRSLGVVFHLEPVTAVGAARPWFMFGGHQATNDSKLWLAFLNATDGAVNVHDRDES